MSEVVENAPVDKEGVHADEIPAANVRSSLASLELQASQVVNRLEYLKMNPEPTQFQLPVTPGFLQPDKKPTAEILSNLETLISQFDSEDDSEFVLPPLDETSHLAVITKSIVAYLCSLERHHLNRVISKVVGDCNRWLGHMFRYIDCMTSFYQDSSECILHALRLAIVARFPDSVDNRMSYLQNVVVYVSENSSVYAIQNAVRYIGLSSTSIRIIPCNTIFGVRGTVDIAALQKTISSDLEANKIPLFMIIDIGSSLCGEVDNIKQIHDICHNHNIWLHSQGHSLAALAVTKGTLTDIKPISDSLTLNLNNWLGITGIPCVLMHRQIQNYTPTLFDVDPILSNKISALTLWTTIQTMGVDSIADRIFMAFDSCRILYEILEKIEGIRILSKAPRQESGKSFRTLMNNPVNFMILFESAAPVIVFQFDGSAPEKKPSPNENTNDDSKDEEAKAMEVITKSIEKISNSSYYDRLNSWLGQILLRDCSQLNLEIIDHPIYGTCIRYCPFAFGYGEILTYNEIMENLAPFLEGQIEILRATVKHKSKFNKLVEESPVLRLIELCDWAGLGGVHYVPEGWETLLTDQAKTELNKLNSILVDTLKATDNAFSLGEGSDGLICVRFGMVTNETDVEELLELVIQTGRKIQENSKILDTMSEILKKGIEAATQDLQRETEEKLWQEGIFRQVPIVGRVVNWWSPPSKEGGVKGRSLNLTQGVVESTENIYKYHMQMTAKPNQFPRNKNPPTPLVQTPISADSISLHSRDGSTSSQNQVNHVNQDAL